MTNETAKIKVEMLDNYLSHTCQDYGERDHEAMMMAIKALEQEPCEDCRTCNKWSECECGEVGHKNGTSIGYSIGECKNYESCEDAISRQAVIDGINEYFHDEYYQRTSIQDCRDCLIEDVIKELPPVTPQPKTGHWIRMKAYEKWLCSECDTVFRFTFKEHDYCPNCGAKMAESEEVKNERNI